MKDWKYGRLIDLALLFLAGAIGGGLVTAVFTSLWRLL